MVNNVEQHKQRTKQTALSGVLLALSTATVFLASFIPGVELTLYALGSFYIAVVIIETSTRGGWLFYAASCFLSLILIPNKTAILPYIVFFGIYGLVKFYIEKLNNQITEIILKLLFFNCTWGLGIYFLKDILLGSIELPDYPVWVLIIGAEAMFLLYDYIYTLAVIYYQKRFQKL